MALTDKQVKALTDFNNKIVKPGYRFNDAVDELNEELGYEGLFPYLNSQGINRAKNKELLAAYASVIVNSPKGYLKNKDLYNIIAGLIIYASLDIGVLINGFWYPHLTYIKRKYKISATNGKDIVEFYARKTSDFNLAKDFRLSEVEVNKLNDYSNRYEFNIKLSSLYYNIKELLLKGYSYNTISKLAHTKSGKITSVKEHMKAEGENNIPKEEFFELHDDVRNIHLKYINRSDLLEEVNNLYGVYLSKGAGGRLFKFANEINLDFSYILLLRIRVELEELTDEDKKFIIKHPDSIKSIGFIPKGNGQTFRKLYTYFGHLTYNKIKFEPKYLKERIREILDLEHTEFYLETEFNKKYPNKLLFIDYPKTQYDNGKLTIIDNENNFTSAFIQEAIKLGFYDEFR